MLHRIFHGSGMQKVRIVRQERTRKSGGFFSFLFFRRFIFLQKCKTLCALTTQKRIREPRPPVLQHKITASRTKIISNSYTIYNTLLSFFFFDNIFTLLFCCKGEQKSVKILQVHSYSHYPFYPNAQTKNGQHARIHLIEVNSTVVLYPSA